LYLTWEQILLNKKKQKTLRIPEEIRIIKTVVKAEEKYSWYSGFVLLKIINSND